MTNVYSAPSIHEHFAVSSHGTLTLIEALTIEAKRFLTAFGFSTKAAVTYRDLRELRYAARTAGLAIN